MGYSFRMERWMLVVRPVRFKGRAANEGG